MPTITIHNLSEMKIPCRGIEKNTLECILNASVDWMHACGGKGRCTTCKMIILEGYRHISELTEAEQKWRNIGGLKENERLTCQCLPLDDIIIKVAETYKFPHIHYSD